jgi:glycosyltransferase involved in cell wall biosynthesis
MTRVHILGTHGVPAAYGGFETAAQEVGLYLAAQGWDVLVYCQIPGAGTPARDSWRSLTRVLVPEQRAGWTGTASFDLTCVRLVLAEAADDDVCLTFGYNTGLFNIAQRIRRIPNVINMDGMEWTRRRWGLARQGILLANERIAGLVGDVLVADHPVIRDYLARHFGGSRVTTITYGAHRVDDAPAAPVHELGLGAGEFATMICRPIPENSCLEIVRAWSARRRGMPLVVLGDYGGDDPYHREVRDAAGPEVRFLGAIHDPEVVGSLRRHSRIYLHGHTVGGTNPSLVEAMAAANPVLARDNVYNRWVAGDGGRYFDDAAGLDHLLTDLLADDATLARMSRAALARFDAEFTWERIGAQYENALRRALTRRMSTRKARAAR